VRRENKHFPRQSQTESKRPPIFAVVVLPALRTAFFHLDSVKVDAVDKVRWQSNLVPRNCLAHDFQYTIL
jgi:hypothetical protein